MHTQADVMYILGILMKQQLQELLMCTVGKCLPFQLLLICFLKLLVNMKSSSPKSPVCLQLIQMSWSDYSSSNMDTFTAKTAETRILLLLCLTLLMNMNTVAAEWLPECPFHIRLTKQLLGPQFRYVSCIVLDGLTIIVLLLSSILLRHIRFKDYNYYISSFI